MVEYAQKIRFDVFLKKKNEKRIDFQNNEKSIEIIDILWFLLKFNITLIKFLVIY
jgi:hypothetical protein